MVSRVTRESILERRLATQITKVKNEKEVLRENRIRLERDFEEQRNSGENLDILEHL